MLIPELIAVLFGGLQLRLCIYPNNYQDRSTFMETGGYQHPEYAPFYDQLKLYRYRMNLSRAKAAALGGTYYASDYSKLERGMILPPKNHQIILNWVKGFQLSQAESVAFVEAAGFPKSILSLKTPTFQANKYPPISAANADERMYNFWPVCMLEPDGTVAGVNLLAARLWGVEAEEYSEDFIDDITERIQSEFIGSSFWKIISRPDVIERIAIPAGSGGDDFWSTMFAVFSKQKEILPRDIVEPFEQAIKRYPVLQLMLEHGNVDIPHEWEYTLMILPDNPSPFSEKAYLEFHVQANRVPNGDTDKSAGYLIAFQPLRNFTKRWLDYEYKQFSEKWHKVHREKEYVQRKRDTHLAEEQEKYPDFEGTVHHTNKWYINDLNTEMEMLYKWQGTEGKMFEGKHFIEFLLNPRTLELMGGFEKNKSALCIPVRQFLDCTADLLVHQEREAILSRLMSIPEYKELQHELMKKSLPQPVKLTGPDEGTACFCFTMEYPLTKDFRFSFGMVARKPSESESDYRMTFVPVDYTSKVALILLRLQNKWEVRKEDQLRWLLAILNTVLEGLYKKKGVGDDWQWKAEKIFAEGFAQLKEAKETEDKIQGYIISTLYLLRRGVNSEEDELFKVLRAFVAPVERASAFLQEQDKIRDESTTWESESGEVVGAS